MIAAWVMLAGGVSWAFVLNTVSFLAVLIALGVSGVRRLPTLQAPSVLHGIRQGMAAVREDSGIALALGIALATGVLVAPFIGLAPAFAVGILGTGAAGTSLLIACQGVGAVSASLGASTFLDRVGSGRWVGLAGVLLGPVAALYWLAPTQRTAMAAVVVLGAVYLGVVTGSSNLCLSRAPRELRARVSSLFNVLLDGGYAVGLITMGWAADRWGLRLVAIVGCALYALFFWSLRRVAAPVFGRLDRPHLHRTSPQALPSSSTG
jgi:predicted MFS family arabinose efflux permease